MTDYIANQIWERVEEAKKKYGEDETSESEKDISWPDPIADEAFHGIAGEIVKMIEPHTEADPVALLMNFLTVFGSIVGDRPHIVVEATKHPMRIFTVLVGKTSKGRKGTSWNHISNIFKAIDEQWYEQITTGLSSGEGLIWAVRDEVKGVNKQGEEIITDPGVTDKRLLVTESELSSTLKLLRREGNILSPVIRNAWDTGRLQTLTKNSPAKSTGAHISVIGHITIEELLRQLTDTEYANGFGNRFMWICVERSKLLPFGGEINQEDFSEIVSKLRDIVSWATLVNRIKWSEQAKQMWIDIYPELSREKPGITGALLGRAEPYVLRLAGIYALLDRSMIIHLDHLKAAIAVWKYAEDSVKYIFQGRPDRSLDFRITSLLEKHPSGLTQSEINKSFGGHISTHELSASLDSLKFRGSIISKDIFTPGRRATLWLHKKYS